MITKTMIAAASILLATGQMSHASSGAAWDRLFARVNGTCIGQSGMPSPEASAPVVFDDSTGKIAVLLRGKLGKGKETADLICLYDKKTGRASIQEYRWLGR